MSDAKTKPNLRLLLLVILLNYLAQIPYYLHNYYYPYHEAPSLGALALLGLTLVWFILGFTRFQHGKPFGYALLLSFLIVEALFYFHTIIFGAFISQSHNPSLIIKAVFLIGYVSGVAAGYFAYIIFKYHRATIGT